MQSDSFLVAVIVSFIVAIDSRRLWTMSLNDCCGKGHAVDRVGPTGPISVRRCTVANNTTASCRSSLLEVLGCVKNQRPARCSVQQKAHRGGRTDGRTVDRPTGAEGRVIISQRSTDGQDLDQINDLCSCASTPMNSLH